MFDRKNKWAILVLLLLCTINLSAQKVTYFLNNDEVTFWDANKSELQSLDLELNMHKLATEFDRIRIQLILLNGQSKIQLDAKTFTSLQMIAQGDNLHYSILSIFGNGREYSDFEGVSMRSLTANYQDELSLTIMVTGEEKTGEITEWTCSSSCYSNCYQSCSGGFMTTSYTYGNGVVLSENNELVIYQKQGWEQKQEKEMKIKAELEFKEKVTEVKRKKKQKVQNSVLGVFSITALGVLVWFDLVTE